MQNSLAREVVQSVLCLPAMYKALGSVHTKLGMVILVARMRSVPHRLLYLNTWSPVVGTVWKGYGLSLSEVEPRWRKSTTGGGLCVFINPLSLLSLLPMWMETWLASSLLRSCRLSCTTVGSVPQEPEVKLNPFFSKVRIVFHNHRRIRQWHTL